MQVTGPNSHISSENVRKRVYVHKCISISVSKRKVYRLLADYKTGCFSTHHVLGFEDRKKRPDHLVCCSTDIHCRACLNKVFKSGSESLRLPSNLMDNTAGEKEDITVLD